MPRRPTPATRWLLALTWPAGIVLTSWDYMWRTTVMHRRETVRDAGAEHLPPAHPDGVDDTDLQRPDDGVGPLFHRRYAIRIRESAVSASALMAQLKTDLNQAAPTKFARFQRVLGDQPRLRLGDEDVVRMPGPWDGPGRGGGGGSPTASARFGGGRWRATSRPGRSSSAPDRRATPSPSRSSRGR